MSDYLVELAGNPQARRLIKSLGLPVPLPTKLERNTGPWLERPLQDRAVVVGAAPGAALQAVLAATLAPAGANPYLVGDPALAAPYVGPGEAYGRPPHLVADGPQDGLTAHGLIYDATGIEGPEDLQGLYEFFHAWVGHLGRSGRALVLGRPAEAAATPEAAAARAALVGFTKSLAKEIGKRGATAHHVVVAEGADKRVGPVARWLLSARSAFVDGQTFHIDDVAGRVPDLMVWTRPLEGRVALVTGGARGIGAATCKALALEGAHVVVLDRPEDDGPASRTARDVGGSLLLADVTAPETPARVNAFLADLGGVDIVVHNAGVTRDKTLAKMSPEQWHQTLDINLGAVTRLTPPLIDGALKDGGRIICLSSIAGIAGNMGQTNYAASKAGIIGYVSALSREVAPRGITVNAVAPGFIETRLTDAMPAVIREVARRFNALSQGGLPTDVAQLITFLATRGSQGVTGTVIRVCGLNMVGA
jgi:3-oxoacyl-[acyl-carrier protein] reductase